MNRHEEAGLHIKTAILDAQPRMQCMLNCKSAHRLQREMMHSAALQFLVGRACFERRHPSVSCSRHIFCSDLGQTALLLEVRFGAEQCASERECGTAPRSAGAGQCASLSSLALHLALTITRVLKFQRC